MHRGRPLLLRMEGWLPDRFHPAQVVVMSFGAVIAIATVLLALPLSSQTGRSTGWIDAFFTATSATCVTGLTVVADTGTYFSTAGQLIILSCIQIGGLGLMTFTTVFLIATGRRLAIADRIAIQESFYHSPTGQVGTLIRYIVFATLLTEALGAGLLASWWLYTGAFTSPGHAVYSAVFHSISAFCNAGFSLYSDSATRFQNDPLVLGILSTLIVAGGLGFLVGLDVKEYLQQRFLSRLLTRQARKRVEAIRPRPRISLHSKFVLTVTGSLLLLGTLSYYFLERGGVLRGMSVLDAVLNSWFCSVTARTAGFNTVDYANFGGPALLCTMVLMFIGASPGSTGGGVKTSTFGLIVTYALFRWRGHEVPHAFGRTIPRETVDRATAVVVAAVGIVILAASLLMATEATGSGPAASRERFLPVMFETFSAFGTVGLSMNFTAGLSGAGKLVLAVLMFVGRVGPLTLALAIGTRSKPAKFRYADENVMVG
jgi:trk system potassium uptake protein